LRKYAVALLAVPILLPIFAGSVLRRSAVVRTAVAISLGAIIGLGAIGVIRPTSTIATPPTEIVPLTQAAFAPIGTSMEVDAPATITFSTAMDPASVEAAVAVDPETAVAFAWNAERTVLRIVPRDHWAPATYHTVTVRPGALAASGRPSTTPARAVFLTRGSAVATIAATERLGKRIAIDSGFTITFDRPVDAATVEAGVRLAPDPKGALTIESADDTTFTVMSATPLRAGTRYKLVVKGVLDAMGVAVEPATLVVRTAALPKVVRFRPFAKTQDVPRSAAISVRFTRPMDRASTKKAFSVTVDGKAVKGKISFAEDDTVLVFDPAKALPYGERVVARVTKAARSADGIALGSNAAAAFRTVAKPRDTTGGGGGGGSSGGGGGGGAVGGGSWASVETYYLRLMNCTRTGGWVTSSGRCSSPGGRNVAPLKLSSGISSRVARPYARLLARRGQCSHFIGGNPGDRLRRAGYSSYRWAENIGCRSGGAKSAVLGSHRFFQSEKSYNGGHYVNLMSTKYDRVGIGVWVASGRVRLVVDFYHP
jgi:uncharacterized protein YkwD